MNHTYTDATLVFLSEWSRTLLGLLCTAVVASSLYAVWHYRVFRTRIPLIALRMFSTVALIWIVLEPALQTRTLRTIPDRIAFVVDNSSSMSVAYNATTTRHQYVQHFLHTHAQQLSHLSKQHTLEWYNLEGLSHIPTLHDTPNHTRTDLIEALTHALQSPSNKPLASVVLISDGADNHTLKKNIDNSTALKESLKHITASGVPINTWIVGHEDAYKDLAVVDVHTDAFAFVHNTFQITATVSNTGFDTTTLQATLSNAEHVLNTQTVTVLPNKEVDVVFNIKPDKMGEYIYTVQIPSFPSDSVTTNNSMSVAVQVIRDKIRVLQVAGRPSWDERFLRQHLKENPNVDLISFFILRTPEDDPAASDQDMSLIPFPVNTLFTTELSSFDVLIFQNFDYRPYRMAQYLPNIQEAVEKGLGFMMLGGPESFAHGGYVNTPVADILPVTMEERAYNTQTLTPLLTQEGKNHPITDIHTWGSNSTHIWNSLPAWHGYNHTGKPTEDSVVLATDNSHMPLIAVREKGAGRTMAIATDSLWRWRFTPVNSQHTVYHTFIAKALRWLVRDPEHSRLKITPHKRSFEASDKPGVSVRVLDTQYNPLPNAQVELVLLNAQHTTVRTDTLHTQAQGTTEHMYQNLAPGAYTVKATQGFAPVQQSAEATFVVNAHTQESVQPAPRPDIMQALATLTQGEHHAMNQEAWEHMRILKPHTTEVDRTHTKDMWDNAWILAALVLSMGLEWFIRRRSGLL